jgi:hypothetical protein
MFDRSLRPEWIDYALEKSMNAESPSDLRDSIRAYLSSEIPTPTSLRKTTSQLEHVVGPMSSIPRERLINAYAEMSSLPPSGRQGIRLRLLVDSTPFVAEVLGAIQRLVSVGANGIEVRQLYDRVAAVYGERGTIPRRVRYVLQTLNYLGVLRNEDSRWYVVEKEALPGLSASERRASS